MATAPEITLPVRADARGLADFARVVAKHMTALADELDQMDGPSALGAAIAAENERIRQFTERDEFQAVVARAFQDAGAVTDMPAATIMAAAAKLAGWPE